jgi:hypothetical protein
VTCLNRRFIKLYLCGYVETLQVTKSDYISSIPQLLKKFYLDKMYGVIDIPFSRNYRFLSFDA